MPFFNSSLCCLASAADGGPLVYVYFSKDPDQFNKQTRKRESIIESIALLDLPTDAEAIIILVELVKHPADKIDQLVRRVGRKGVRLSTQKIKNLLIYHGILKKKPLDLLPSEA